MKKWVKVTLLCLVILVNILLAYQPHFNYSYPILADEYNHISLGKYISEEHKLPFSNPYIINNPKITNLESGFHFFLAIIFSIIPGEPVLYYKYFIVLFMVINSLLLFYLVFLWFKNYCISLLSVLFYGTIKSTGDLLVHNYFLPLTTGVTLLFLSFIFFHKWENAETNKLFNKYLVYLIIVLLITTLTYPPALTFFAGVLFLYILFITHKIHEKFNVKKKHFLIYFVIISGIIIIASLVLMKYLNLTDYLIFQDTWTPIQAKYSPIFFFGIISSIFAFFGLFSVIKENKNKVILFWFIFSLIQIYMYYIFKFNILVPFARLFVFYLIGMCILSGVGVVYLTDKITYYVEKNKYAQYKKHIKQIVIFIIIALLFTNYWFVYHYNLTPRYIIDNESYEVIKFINNNYNENITIMSTGLISHAIYPMTGNRGVGVINANLGGGYQKEINDFLNGGCAEKENMLKQYYFPYFINNNITHEKTAIISKVKFNCTFLKQVYGKKYYIYELEEGKIVKPNR